MTVEMGQLNDTRLCGLRKNKPARIIQSRFNLRIEALSKGIGIFRRRRVIGRLAARR
jgi:hypothetical protein